MYHIYGMKNGRLEAAHRLKDARVARGYASAAEAAEAFGWNRNTYASNENGNAPYSFRSARRYGEAFGVSAAWLYEGLGTPESDVAETPTEATERLVPIVGRVGADPEGVVLFATGQTAGDLAPIPPGGTSGAFPGRRILSMLVARLFSDGRGTAVGPMAVCDGSAGGM